MQERNRNPRCAPSAHRALVAGPFPEPLHGFAFANLRVEQILSDAGSTTQRFDLAPGRGSSAAARIFDYVRRVLKGFANLSTLGSAGTRTLHIGLSGGLRQALDTVVMLYARAFGWAVVVHHHNFTYLDRPSSLALVATWAAGARATHVVLCNRMGMKLAQRYPVAVRRVVVSNIGLMQLPTGGVPRRTGPPRVIGLLSNLTTDKGLVTFLRLVELARQAGQPVEGILAGPLREPAAIAAIQAAEARNVPVSYRGAVYGADKERFFRDLDLFVFPTRYPNEAEPFVVLEALAHGVPVLASCRGCLPEMINDGSGRALNSEEAEDFHSLLSDLWGQPNLFEEMREAAYRRRARMADEAAAERAKLVQLASMHSATHS